MGLNNFNGIYSADEQEVTVFKKIPKSDVKYNPFFAYKQWISYSGSATNLALPLTAIYSKSVTQNGLPAIDSNLPYDKTTNIDGSLRILTYYSLNNLIYKRKDQPYHTIGCTNLNNTNKVLYQSASILSFPYVTVGEGIKPQSFTFDVPGTLSLKSDRYGNIYDTAIDTSSFVSDVMFYEGFNEYFDTTRIKNEYSPLTFIPGVPNTSGVTFIPGVPTTSGATASIGLAAKFNNTGSITTTIPGIYSKSTDYSISFFVSASYISSNRTIIGLSTIRKTQSYKPSVGIVDSLNSTSNYPFKIELISGSKIQFGISANSSNKTQITSSFNVNNWTHVVCQKTGSNIELYINGTLNASGSISNWNDNTSINSSNRLDIGYNSISSLNGVLDEIRIYNKALTSANITSLNNRSEDNSTFLQTNNVGNVFHKHGLAVISSPHYKYNNILNTNYVTTHKSTKRLYELNVLTRVQAGEFNMSMNPSMLTDNNTTYATFVTGSDFSPYITTIGLYDKYGRLLAIGKLGQPIKKRDDVDMNFVIRIDLDAPISWKS